MYFLLTNTSKPPSKRHWAGTRDKAARPLCWRYVLQEGWNGLRY
jgi:hypothetical protein